MVQEVGVSFDRIEPGTCTSTSQYSIAGANDPRNLVFPFYVIPDQELTGPTVPAPRPKLEV